jgi:hypothetical protein
VLRDERKLVLCREGNVAIRHAFSLFIYSLIEEGYVRSCSLEVWFCQLGAYET